MQGEISANGLIVGGMIGQRGAPGNGIVSITYKSSSGLEDTYEILYTNGNTEEMVVTNGAEGNGISSITKTSSVGLVDTYTILYTNGSSDTIEVHNGEKGDTGDTGQTGATPNLTIGSVTKGADASATITGTTDDPVLNLVLPKGDKGDKGNPGDTGATGVGIYSVTKTGTADLVDTYTILYTNGDTTTFTITNGAKGDTGATGNGISSISKTGTSGLVDTYTITYTNGNTDTFEVTNGADGSVTDVQVEGTSVVDNGVANIVGLATQAELDYYKTIYNVLPKVSGNGENITLDNTGESILKLDLKGNTSQTGTPTPDNPIPVNVVSGDNEVVVTGKNLFEVDNTLTVTNKGFDISSNGQNIIINGTYNGSAPTSYASSLNGNFVSGNYAIYINPSKTQLLKAGTYAVSVNNVSGTYTNCTIMIYIISKNASTPHTSIKSCDFSSSTTFTIAEDKECFLCVSLESLVANTSIINNLTFNIQLEKGNTATTYTPYQSQTYPINLPVGNIFTDTLEQGTINGSNGDNDSGGTTNRIREINFTNVKSSTEYTLNMSTSVSKTLLCYVFEYKDDNTFIQRIPSNWTTLPYNFTTSANTKKVRILVKFDDDATITPSDVSNITLYKTAELGLDPIELCDQDKFIRNSGKNLFEEKYKNNVSDLVEGRDLTNTEINLDLTSAIGKTYITTGGYFKAGTYTLTNYSATYLSFNRIAIAGTNCVSSSAHLRNSYTWTQNVDGYTYFGFEGDAGETSYTDTPIANELFIMVNEGSTALPYEPYGNGDWYLEKHIGKVVLDGTQYVSNVNSSSTNTSRVAFYSLFDFVSSDILCDKLIVSSGAWGTDAEAIYFARSGGADQTKGDLYFRINKSLIGTTAETYNTYASQNNIIIYMPISPTYTKITNSTLISQLDAIDKALSKDGQTNISQINNDNPFKIYASALQKISGE